MRHLAKGDDRRDLLGPQPVDDFLVGRNERMDQPPQAASSSSETAETVSG